MRRAGVQEEARSRVRQRRWLRLALVLVLCSLLAWGCAALAGCGSDQVQDPIIDTADTSGGVAATVNGIEIGENAITAYIENRREVESAQDDAAWAAWLAEQGYTPSTLRTEVLNTYIYNALIEQLARQEGASVSDADVEEYRESQWGALSEEQWQQQLDSWNMSDERWRYNTKIQLLSEALEEKVATEQMTFSEYLNDQRDSANVEVNTMPEGLSYDVDMARYGYGDEDGSDE